MIYPKIDDLLEKVPSKYALVIAAARRPRWSRARRTS
jgi:DNA-directed RNA polymerase omega subunit